jgi:hypothetical protein
LKRYRPRTRRHGPVHRRAPFRFGLYLTVHAASEDDLAEEVAAVRAVASSLLLVTCLGAFRSLQGWVTTLPAGTAALAAAFPFTAPTCPAIPRRHRRWPAPAGYPAAPRPAPGQPTITATTLLAIVQVSCPIEYSSGTGSRASC